jgi:plastocyanin
MLLSHFLTPLRARRAWLSAGALAAVVIATATLFGAADSSAAGGNTVRTEGTAQFIPNSKLAFTLRFSPGHMVVKSGETLTLEHSDKAGEPHTLSVVDADEVPADLDAVFNCGEPGTVCDEVFSLFPGEPTAPVFVEGPGTGEGIDGRLDTLFVTPGGSISEEVTAEPGTTLHFICAIHAWMQGDITVK